jgi:hypothetical protein
MGAGSGMLMCSFSVDQDTKVNPRHTKFPNEVLVFQEELVVGNRVEQRLPSREPVSLVESLSFDDSFEF